MAYVFEDGAAFAERMDAEDPLRKFKERFYCPPGMIYMDGNSLGLCSKDAKERVLEVLERWEKDPGGIWGSSKGFFFYPGKLAARIAPIIGADKSEVTIMTNTTVNIHQCFTTLYKPTAERYKIVMGTLNYPTDRYAVDSEVRLHNLDPKTAVKVVQSRDGSTVSEDDVIAAMTPDVALVFLPSVLYVSCQLLDMPRLTAAAHERGILIGFDLCHSIGAVPHHLDEFGPDFAVWCNYKYMNGGPGTIGGLYINKRHLDKAPGLAGWFGNNIRTVFWFKQEFDPAEGATRFLTGTHPVISMAALDGTLKVMEEAGINAIREKSLKITGYLMYLIDTKLAKYGFSVGNPREDERRGGHVALQHEKAQGICGALRAKNVIPDFRYPNVIRLAPVALYTSYSEVWHMVEIIEDIAKNKTYEQYSKVW